MSEPRIKPILLATHSGSIYSISGWHDGPGEAARLKTCEKYSDPGGWTNIETLSDEPTAVFAIGQYLYSFGVLEAKQRCERLDTNAEEGGWEVQTISIPRDDPAPGALSNYGVVNASMSSDCLCIFGGMYGPSLAPPFAYTFEWKTGTLQSLPGNFHYKLAFTDTYAEGATSASFLTRCLRVCVYHKARQQWTLRESNIEQKILASKLTLKRS